MSAVLDRPVRNLPDLDDLASRSLTGEAEPETPVGHQPEGTNDEERSVKLGMVAVSTMLSCLGAAWMVTRVFRGTVAAPAVALIGIAIGVGAVYLSHRFGRGGALQYLALPVSLLLGGVLATTGETAGRSLPSSIVDAFRGGGLLQPPIPFDAGWRFLLIVLFTFLSACACGAAISGARPKLAVAIPMPLVIGGALIQPKGTEIVASAVATVFVVAALSAVAYGADLASEGVSGGSFETRRLMRGAGLLVFAIVGLVAISQTNFLFPDTKKDQVIPPQRPPTPPPEADRVLFTVKSDRSGPWRLGVLDVYQDNAFMLPSVDPKRTKKVPPGGVVGAAGARGTYTATFTIADVKGQTLPSPPVPAQITGVKRKLQFDPRTQIFKLVDVSVPHGLTYTITSPLPADGKELAASPAPDPAIAREFGAASMPAPPPGVRDLLSRAPTTNPFDRLQFLRQALYSKVVAAGGGRPVDVPVARVDDMLNGGQATPFEINAAEVMLSRWGGIPARLGFGYYGGDKAGDALAFRPKHGAAWLESYFQGSGWVPVVGTPPKAKSSLSNQPKKNDPKVVPTDELGLTVYVPVELQNIQLLYQIVRYYVATYGPILLTFLLLLFSYPALLKRLRSTKRRRWALQTSPAARVVVAYAELRDTINDLNAGDARATPIEMLDTVVDDEEHAELAWLVTRAIWGDLSRDLRIEDVEAAEEMSRAVRRRILRDQTSVNRVLAATSRASLRDPWTDEVPNLWLQRREIQTRRRSRFLPGRRRRLAAAAAVAATLFSSCAHQAHSTVPGTYLQPLMPAGVSGYQLVREERVETEFQKPGHRALVTGGQVFTLHDGDAIQGSVQFSLFKPKVDTRKTSAQAGVLRGLGSVEAFRPMHMGLAHLQVLQTAEQQIFVWFPPERNAMEVFIMRKSFKDAEQVVGQVIAFQRQLPGAVTA